LVIRLQIPWNISGNKYTHPIFRLLAEYICYFSRTPIDFVLRLSLLSGNSQIVFSFVIARCLRLDCHSKYMESFTLFFAWLWYCPVIILAHTNVRLYLYARLLPGRGYFAGLRVTKRNEATVLLTLTVTPSLFLNQSWRNFLTKCYSEVSEILTDTNPVTNPKLEIKINRKSWKSIQVISLIYAFPRKNPALAWNHRQSRRHIQSRRQAPIWELITI
jgi:hypothetical protein